MVSVGVGPFPFLEVEDIVKLPKLCPDADDVFMPVMAGEAQVEATGD
jgi:hypothetical protein